MLRFLTTFTALTAPLLALAAPTDNSLSKRGPTDLSKRTPGRATYYQVGLGACGQYNVPSDFIVALNQAQFDLGGYPSPQCFRGITISYNGRTAHATVMDECPDFGCNYGDLDMSEGLFTFFEPTSVGVFYMEWWFDGEGPAAPPPAPAPTTTYQPPPPDPVTSSTPQYTPPTTTTQPTSTYVPPTSSVFSEQAVETTSATTPEDGNTGGWNGGVLDGANKVALQFANLMFAAGA